MFRRMFGGGGGGSSSPTPSGTSAPKTASVLDTVNSVDQMISSLEKKTELLQKQIDAETATIKQLMSNPTELNKKKAMHCLKKKKLYEKQKDNAENQIFSMVEKREALAALKETAEVVRIQGAVANTMKQFGKDLNVDKVDKVVDDLAEGMDNLQVIQQRLNEPSGMLKDLDESELEDELAEFAAEGELEQQTALPAVPSTKIPQAPAPTAATPAKKKEMTEEEELMALAAEMA